MKQAVIDIKSKQYLVKEGQTLDVDLVSGLDDMEVTTLLLIEDGKVTIGKPTLDTKVKLSIVENDVKQDKIVAIRYKAKKRVSKVRGFRAIKTVIKVDSIG